MPTHQEIKEAWWRIFLTRKVLHPIPEGLAPVGSLVRLAIGRQAEVICWLGAKPDEGTPIAHKRLAYVVAADGPDAGISHGLVEEDEVHLWHTQDQPKYLPEFLGKVQ